MAESLKTTKDIDAVDADGCIALHRAVEKGDVDKVERLLAAGANVDARTTRGFASNCTPLIVATQQNRFDVMRLLLERGVDIEACDGAGYGNEKHPCVSITPRIVGPRCSTQRMMYRRTQ